MKTCYKCKTEKEFSEFSKSKRKTGGAACLCKDCSSLYHKKYYLKNKEKIIKRGTDYHFANPERVAKGKKRWKQANKNKVNAYSGQRRAQKLQATVSWADKEAIQRMYTIAVWCSKNLGEDYHVDHVIPLQGEKICGLHVEYNLDVITATENSEQTQQI